MSGARFAFERSSKFEYRQARLARFSLSLSSRSDAVGRSAAFGIDDPVGVDRHEELRAQTFLRDDKTRRWMS